MLNLQTLPFLYLLIQYVVGAAIIIALTTETARRFKANPITLPFYLFATFVVLWELLVFFHRITEKEIEAIALFKMIGIIHPYIYGFYFLTFLNIWRARLLNLLCLVPSFFGSVLIALYVDYGVKAGAFGWSYYQKQTGSPLIDLIIYATTIVIMLILVSTLTYLIIKSPSRELKRKFLYILAAFILFQVIGVPITNLVFLQNNPDFPPLGGFFYLANLVVIYLQIRPQREKVVFAQRPMEHIPGKLAETIKAFYDNLSPGFDTLGIKYFKFLSYLRECGLAEIVKLENDKMELISEEKQPIGPTQIIRFIDISLTLMEEKELDQRYSDTLIDFINENYEKISEDVVVTFKKHEKYLRGSTILDKVAGGSLRLLFAPYGFTEEDLDRFSKTLKIQHGELRKTPVLLKFSLEKDFVASVEDYVREGLANGGELYIFTRNGSQISSRLKSYNTINYFYLTPSISTAVKIGEKEKMVSTNDLSQILGAIMQIKNEGRMASIVFDNLTDLIFLIGFDQAYKMVRHALDVGANSRIHFLFLINKETHGKDVLSAFESLFKIVTSK